jgi:hypothetical protein
MIVVSGLDWMSTASLQWTWLLSLHGEACTLPHSLAYLRLYLLTSCLPYRGHAHRCLAMLSTQQACIISHSCAGPRLDPINDVTTWIRSNCRSATLTGKAAYEMQDLFSIYVHRSPDAPHVKPDSVFAGRDVPDRCARSVCFAVQISHQATMPTHVLGSHDKRSSEEPRHGLGVCAGSQPASRSRV